MKTPINITTLPREEAVRFARASGAAVGSDRHVMAASIPHLTGAWLEHVGPSAERLTDDDFNGLVSELCDAFAEGVRDIAPHPKTLRAATDSFQTGLRAALALLESWQARNEERVTPGQMMAELIAGYYGRIGDERRGFTNTLMAWIMIALKGGAPILDCWNPATDLAQWRGDHE